MSRLWKRWPQIEHKKDGYPKSEFARPMSPRNDAGFVAEMDRRMAELESGKVKGYTWDEVKQRARGSIKPKKRK